MKMEIYKILYKISTYVILVLIVLNSIFYANVKLLYFLVLLIIINYCFYQKMSKINIDLLREVINKNSKNINDIANQASRTSDIIQELTSDIIQKIIEKK